MIKTIGFFFLWLAGSAAAVAVAWTGVSIVDDEHVDPAPANIPIAAPVTNSAATATSPGSTPTSSSDPALADGSTAASTTDGDGAAPRETPTDLSATAPTQPRVDSGEAPAGPSATATSPTAPSLTAPSPTATSPTATSTTESPPAAPSTAAQNSSTAAPTPSTAAPTSATTQRSTTTAAPATTTTQRSTTTTAPTTTAAPPPPTTASGQTLTFNLVGGSTAISFSAAGVDVLWASPNPGFTVKIEHESPGIKVEFEADHHESRVDAWWSGGPRHEIREKPD